MDRTALIGLGCFMACLGVTDPAAADPEGARRRLVLPSVGYEAAPGQAPGAQPLTFDRRSFELRLGGGGWFANCLPGAHRACSGFNAGGDVSWRVGSAFGWGVSASHGSLGSDQVAFTETFVGLTARVHPLGRGRLDPYAELSTGVAWVAGSLGGSGAEAGPQLSGHLGLDVYVSERLEIGPYVGVSERFGSYEGLCTIDPACIDAGAGPWHTSLRVGMRIGVAFGDKL